jgi:hypothetical protein
MGLILLKKSKELRTKAPIILFLLGASVKGLFLCRGVLPELLFSNSYS